MKNLLEEKEELINRFNKTPDAEEKEKLMCRIQEIYRELVEEQFKKKQNVR